MNILVTGATGLIGNDACAYLTTKGHSVVRGVRESHPVVGKYVLFELSDIESNAELDALLGEIDVLIHAAAKMPEPGEDQDAQFDDYERFNANATYKLIDRAFSKGVKQFIYISGVNVVDAAGSGMTEDAPYSFSGAYIVSKIAGELYSRYCMERGEGIATILRVSAPYGPGYRRTSVVPLFCERAMRGENITLWGAGKRQQVFTYVRDISVACELAIQKGCGGIYNIAGARSTTMEELANLVIEAVGNSDSQVEYSGDDDPQEGRIRSVSIAKAKNELGYEPQYDMRRGLMEMIQNIKHA